MKELLSNPTIEKDGWALLSAELRAEAAPATFIIPARAVRESLSPGDAVKLLFDIETREGGRVIDRGIDRMWVIIKGKAEGIYIGVLDNDPGTRENVSLHERDYVIFRPEHVADVGRPPNDYIVEKYGASFLED